MKLTGLRDLISHLEPIPSLREKHGRTGVYGLLGAGKASFAAAAQARLGTPLLLVTSHAQTAQDLAHELPFWTDAHVELFPAVESLPYERVFLDRLLLSRRETVLRGLRDRSIDIVVTPARSLLQPVRPPVDSGAPATVSAGDKIVVDYLIAGWLARGYVEAPVVESPGTFARRGGVIDVFPAAEELPVRIELFGNEVESIRRFDIGTQRSVERVGKVTIHDIVRLDEDVRLQALERLMSLQTEDMTPEARDAWMDDLGRLDAGSDFDDLAVFGPYLLPQRASLLDHLAPETAILIDEANETRTVLSDLWTQSLDLQSSWEANGLLPHGLEPALEDPEGVLPKLEGFKVIELLPGSPETKEDLDLSGLLQPARLFAGRFRDFIREVKTKPSHRFVITTFQPDRIAELLSEEGIAPGRTSSVESEVSPGVTLLPESLYEGFTLAASGVSLLTDHELFGRPRARPVLRPKRAAREVFFAQFAPGDYVVHLEHGIGRFDSITKMEVDGAEREYAVVQYAGADRVYVPTDQLERLTRYIGVGDTPPTLHKLGGGEWQRARQRAKQAAADIAKELIDVYAKRRARPAFAYSSDTPWQNELESSFSFIETPDQMRAVEEVKLDMEEPRPMDRLVCADVGYGKTEVAVRAAFKAIQDGKQVAVLVPTTILAQQHLETFTERLAAFPVKVEALSRFRSPSEQRDILRRVATGEVDVLIGTHRLLQKDVSFKDLGLLIIDEEQRFGVRHKETLKKMRESIDVLTLTATPIPRTLHMGLVGIREISVIETPPEGRLPIKTHLQPYDERLVREAIIRELDREGQVYFVHNKVATIDAVAERIRNLVPEARILVAHGQMDEAQLEKVMLSFAHHQADVLICSTIIENGLDIPNVNTIVVNNAQRLGLTQLYQLRGRVGRSANQAYAYLLYPRDAVLSRDAMRRMEAVFEAQELGAGMNIALRDLEIRGVGNLLGAEQSGHASAIGFDLYTRMIGEAVERLRGVPVKEEKPVQLDLPLTMYLPAAYVGSEPERLSLYRRLASVESQVELEGLRAEIEDRFGPLPEPAENLVASVGMKLLAKQAGISSISLNREQLVLRAEPGAVYDRIGLYKKYGTEARVSTNVLRIPRHLIGQEWFEEINRLLSGMIDLKESLANKQPVGGVA